MKNNKGLLTMIICGVLTIIIIVGCVFFSDEIFNFFAK